MPIHDWTRVTAGIFHHFHLEWISTIQRELNAGILPEGYYAMAEQVAGGVEPDILTLGSVKESSTEFEVASQTPSAGQLSTLSPSTRFFTSTDAQAYSSHQRDLVIRHSGGDDVVAIIELVSPGNKSSQNAFASFVDKVIAFIKSGIHVMIVDLFPPSKRDPNGIHAAIWKEIGPDDYRFELPEKEPLTLVSYCAGLEWSAFIEPVAVGMKLPDMPLFLKRDGHVSVPLERSYTTAFEGVPERWRRELL